MYYTVQSAVNWRHFYAPPPPCVGETGLPLGGENIPHVQAVHIQTFRVRDTIQAHWQAARKEPAPPPPSDPFKIWKYSGSRNLIRIQYKYLYTRPGCMGVGRGVYIFVLRPFSPLPTCSSKTIFPPIPQYTKINSSRTFSFYFLLFAYTADCYLFMYL